MANYPTSRRREALRYLSAGAVGIFITDACGDDRLPTVQPPPVPVWRLDEPAAPVPENFTSAIADGIDYRTPGNNFLYTHTMNDHDLFPGSVGALSEETIARTRSAAVAWHDVFSAYRQGVPSVPSSGSGGTSLRDALGAAYIPLILEMNPGLLESGDDSGDTSPSGLSLRALSHLDTLLLNGIVPDEQAMLSAGYVRCQAPGELPGRHFSSAYVTMPLLVNGAPALYLAVDGFPILNSRGMSVSPLQSLDSVVRVMGSIQEEASSSDVGGRISE